MVLESPYQGSPLRVNRVIHVNNGTPELSQVTLDSDTCTSLMSPQMHKEQKRKISDVVHEEEDSSSEAENCSGVENGMCGMFTEGDSICVNGLDVPLDTSMSQNLSRYQSRADSKDNTIQELKQEVDQLKEELDQTRNDLKVATSRIEEYVKILKNENLFLSKEEAQLIVLQSKKRVFRYIKIVTDDMKDDSQFRKSVRVKQAMEILLPDLELEERLKKWIVYKQSVIKGLKEQAKQQTRNITTRYNGKCCYCIACFNEELSNKFFLIYEQIGRNFQFHTSLTITNNCLVISWLM